jgi:hypothetical protein
MVTGQVRREEVAGEERLGLDVRVILGEREDPEVQLSCDEPGDLLGRQEVRDLRAVLRREAADGSEKPLEPVDRQMLDAAPPARRASATATSKLANTFRASAASTRPASVVRTVRLLRSSSRTPSCSSSRRIACESGGWDMCMRSAARPKCSSSTTARK